MAMTPIWIPPLNKPEQVRFATTLKYNGLGVQLDEWHRDILEPYSIPLFGRVFVKGNTGCGKGAAAGIACCTYFHIWDDAKIVITRDSLRMAQKIAYGEVDNGGDE